MEKYFRNFEYKNNKKSDKKPVLLKSFNDYEKFLKYNFTIKEYKDIMRSFNLKCNKTKKKEIQHYCTNALFLSSKCNKIQRCWRRHFICLFNKSLGPGYFKRSISNNVEDFLTMEHVNEIDYYHFFSFKDDDNFIYTFNIVSIYNLINKNLKYNPYNRKPFSGELINLVYLRLKYNKILNKIEKFGIIQPRVYTMEERLTNTIMKINELGNYASESWFTELTANQYYKFLFELCEIWYYRAQLTQETRCDICPPNGNPFLNVPRTLLNTSNSPRFIPNIRTMRNYCINVMEKMLYSSPNASNQSLGALYILSSLTLVSENARENLPWLYASVTYN
jgi:hypothetical protein